MEEMVKFRLFFVQKEREKREDTVANTEHHSTVLFDHKPSVSH